MSYPRIILGVSSTQIYKDDNNLVFYNNNTDILSINNNGNVGIGKSTPSSKLDVNGDVIISGNLTVNGDVISINTSTLNVEDSMIKLSINNTGDSIDSGFYTQYVDGGITKFSGFYRDATNGTYSLFDNSEIEPTSTVNINATATGYQLASLSIDDLNCADIDSANLIVTNSVQLETLNVSSNVGIGNFNSPNIHLAIGDSDTGFHQQGDGELSVYTNNLERVRFDNSGNVGIGDTNPSEKLEVDGNTNINGILKITKNDGEKIQLTPFGSAGSKIMHHGGWSVDHYAGPGTGGDTGSFRFFTTANSTYTERIRILTNGNVGIGETSPSYQLELSTDSAAKPISSSWTIASDRRLKEDIQNANLDICYDDIKNIPLRRFKWCDRYIEKYNVKDKHNLGFIAQEVEKINKSCINTSKNIHFNIKDFKTLNKDQLMMSLFGAVKKLQNIQETTNNDININDIIHESIYEKTEPFINALDILKEIKPFQYLDKNNNKKDLSEEDNLFLYAIDDKSLNNYFNILSNGKNKYLPTINRNGKIINNEIELYNHKLNIDDEILIKFTIDNNTYEKVVKVTKIIDTTHINIDTTNINMYLNDINNRKIYIYGKNITDFDYLNLKFLYSLISFNISSTKDFYKLYEDNKVNIQNEIKICKNLINDNKLRSENNKVIINKIGENFNKLVGKYQESTKTINILSQENELLKKQVTLNQKNINLLNEHLNKQSIIINQLLQKK